MPNSPEGSNNFQHQPQHSQHNTPRSTGSGTSAALMGSTSQVTAQPSAGTSSRDVRLNLHNLPAHWDAGRVYNHFKRYGRLVMIEQYEKTPNAPAKTFLVYSPGEPKAFTSDMIIEKHRVRLSILPSRGPMVYRSKDKTSQFAEKTTIHASQLAYGVMENEDCMLLMHFVNATRGSTIELMADLKRCTLDISFPLSNPEPRSADHRYMMRLQMHLIRGIAVLYNEITKGLAWILSVDQPPLMFRQAENIGKTHDKGAKYWNEWQTWYRQTGVQVSVETLNEITQLHKGQHNIDVGRCLHYRVVLDKASAESVTLQEMYRILTDQGIAITHDRDITFKSVSGDASRKWLDNSISAPNAVPNASLAELHEMAEERVNLTFEVRYQLEACLSNGIFHECNFTEAFLHKLASFDQRLATKLLEKALDEKERIYLPDSIFNRLLHKVSTAHKPMPAYCAMIRAATVTPTSIYFMTPVPETSNRIVRKYQHYGDRFLRVKFTDEKYKGRMQSSQDATMNDIYIRIKRTMTNGIRVGNRHYEFLAFGNSQFREHGAWFFAPTNDLTAQQIRDQMGQFSNITSVAKYCSRMGQCFSTTRTASWHVQETRITDIKLNGYNFTDGVGKISRFLAQMIAHDRGYSSSEGDYPSAFQFRREGCKGILVVDPMLTGHAIHTRSSQDKFDAASHAGLEIVRISQFSTAYLNVQLILVLSTLGVNDGVFLGKMRHAIRDLAEAMHSEQKALDLLRKNIDFNRMTLELSKMILDGFMDVREPFIMSCLRLWRTWSLKYLKEKSRIFVDQGAFVLGCVDETATLKGHYDASMSLGNGLHEPSALPEIFLQIDRDGKGNWQIIEGVCVVARNPSLHPGDVRIVRAVDIPRLRHIRNCVVFPQTGDRDLPNMCSGGDLDGDDYLVMWDETLIPEEWNHAPMDFTAPTAASRNGPVSVEDMCTFFVEHMKYDNLGPIAVAHRYHADRSPYGVKDPKCLELARLHSVAVDFAKSGVPAEMPKSLRALEQPHWSEPKHRKGYHSNKVIGKLYDEVRGVDFRPDWELPFDKRILEAYTLDQTVLNDAREVKELYDTAMRRIMAKFSIETEFEVWTTFVLKHGDDMNDYKFAETIGESVTALKEAHQQLCYDRAGTDIKERDWMKMGPFIAAMYTVTAEEVSYARAEHNKCELRDGIWVATAPSSVENMPFMSFPWLFAAELGRIANGQDGKAPAKLSTQCATIQQQRKPAINKIPDAVDPLDDLEEIILPSSDSSLMAPLTPDDTTPVDKHRSVESSASVLTPNSQLSPSPTPSSSSQHSDVVSTNASTLNSQPAALESAASGAPDHSLAERMEPSEGVQEDANEDDDDDEEEEDEEAEMVDLGIVSKPTAFDALMKFLET